MFKDKLNLFLHIDKSLKAIELKYKKHLKLLEFDQEKFAGNLSLERVVFYKTYFLLDFVGFLFEFGCTLYSFITATSQRQPSLNIRVPR